MCDKLRYNNPRIDNCLKKMVERLNKLSNFKTLASCCGHDVYNATIVMKDKKGDVFELFSRRKLEVKKRNRYYKKDINGFYYIPEIYIRKNENKM